jgi:hypothetical protein
MPDERARFLEEASRCRRLAASINDEEASAKIEALAVECERRAGALGTSKEMKNAKPPDNS